MKHKTVMSISIVQHITLTNLLVNAKHNINKCQVIMLPYVEGVLKFAVKYKQATSQWHFKV